MGETSEKLMQYPFYYKQLPCKPDFFEGRITSMSVFSSASDSRGTILILYSKVHVLFIGYDVTIKYWLHLELSSQKMDLETKGYELETFQFPISNPNTLPLS